MAKTPISVRLAKILTSESAPTLYYDYKDKYCFLAENPETNSTVLICKGETLDEAIGNYFSATAAKNTRKRAPRVAQSESNDESVANG
jgi:hypothetical protein